MAAPRFRSVLGVVLAVVLAVGLLAVAPACGRTQPTERTEPTGFSGYSRSPTPDVAGVSLPVVAGEGGASFVAAPGGLRLVVFVFTSCPDVCPTTLAVLRRALADLPPAERARVAVDVVTVDPARDDPVRLAEYVGGFLPGATSHRTTDEALLRSALDAFGGDATVDPGGDGVPQVSHSADVAVVDDRGRVVLAWPAGTAAGPVVADLRRLLAGDRPTGSTSAGATDADHRNDAGG